MNKRALTTQEAAHYCGVSESLLRQARMTSPSARKLDAPNHLKLGRKKVLYLHEDLDEWLESHKTNQYRVDISNA